MRCVGKLLTIVAVIFASVVLSETEQNGGMVKQRSGDPNGGSQCPQAPKPVGGHGKPSKPIRDYQTYRRPANVKNPNQPNRSMSTKSMSSHSDRSHKHRRRHRRHHRKPHHHRRHYTVYEVVERKPRHGRPHSSDESSHRKPHHRRHRHHSRRHSSRKSEHKKKKPKIHAVEIKKDKGFYPFKFGRSQTIVPVSFNYNSDKATIITISDCGCEGDQFNFYNNNVFIGTTDQGCGLTKVQALFPPIASSFSSSFVPDSDCPKCDHYQTDPEICLQDGFHCYGQAVLLPGQHNITITVNKACDRRKRVGYIRVDTACVDTGMYVPCCLEGIGCSNKINRWWIKKEGRSKSSDNRKSSHGARRQNKQSSGHRRRRHHRHHRRSSGSSSSHLPSLESRYRRNRNPRDCNAKQVA